MLDKNPNMSLIRIDEFFSDILKSGLNFFYSDSAFVKTKFFETMINNNKYPVFYFDFDLLFSGYISSKFLELKNDTTTIIQPEKEEWNNNFSGVLQKISLEKSIIVIDSLNGFFTLFDKIESTRFVNSCIMLLNSLCFNTKSIVIIGALSKFRDDDGWVLVPTSRKIIDVKVSTQCFLKEVDSQIIVDIMNKNKVERTLKLVNV